MKKIILIFLIGLGLFSCKKEFTDHNKIVQDDAFTIPEAYDGIVLGMTKEFAENTIYRIIHGPGLTAREFGNMSTYETESQLVDGGPELTGVNSSISGLWRHLHKNRGIAEKILENIDKLEFANQTEADEFNPKKLGYKAYAKLIQAITTGYMADYWEKVTLKNNPENQATFVDRNTGYQTAIDNIDEALNLLNGKQDAIDYINGLVSSEFSIVDVLNAFKARYEIELGNYQDAYDAADAVDLTKRSVWTYDGSSMKNPIFANTIYKGSKRRINPIDSLGLIGSQTPETNDERNDFYLDYKPGNSKSCNLPVDDPEGFWTSQTATIPVYLPGEMLLIKAEAKARLGGANLAEAVTLIDQVRTKNPANDAFGVGANLAAWTGNASDQQAVLDEIYKNYAIELFLQGQRWPIHRRFYPNYLDGIDWNNVSRCSLERLNNFYPYPDQERSNNPNCPADPAY